MSVELTLHWLPWTGSMAVAVWLVEPDGPITRLGSLKSHPAATLTSGIAVGSNGPVKGCWLARGVLQFPWGKNSAVGTPTPALQAGPIGIGIWGVGRHEASRETREHGGNFRLEGRKPWFQRRESQPTGRFSFVGRRNLRAYLPRLVSPPPP